MEDRAPYRSTAVLEPMASANGQAGPPDPVPDPEPVPANTPDLSRFKIPPRAVPSDDCEIKIGRRVEGETIVDEGESHYPHVGETVWVLPVGTMQAYFRLADLASASTAAGSVDGISGFEAKLTRLAEALSHVVAAWDWTDIASEPLPQPYRNPAVLAALEWEELQWLCDAAQGESPGERKNASAPSRPTSRAERRHPPK